MTGTEEVAADKSSVPSALEATAHRPSGAGRTGHVPSRIRGYLSGGRRRSNEPRQQIHETNQANR